MSNHVQTVPKFSDVDEIVNPTLIHVKDGVEQAIVLNFGSDDAPRTVSLVSWRWVMDVNGNVVPATADDSSSFIGVYDYDKNHHARHIADFENVYLAKQAIITAARSWLFENLVMTKRAFDIEKLGTQLADAEASIRQHMA